MSPARNRCSGFRPSSRRMGRAFPHIPWSRKTITKLLKFIKFTNQRLQSARRFLTSNKFLVRSAKICHQVEIALEGVYLMYISFQGNELGGEDWCLSREINFSLEGLQMCPWHEKAPDGLYSKYCSFGALIERAQMRPYHEKYLLLEGVRLGLSQKKIPSG